MITRPAGGLVPRPARRQQAIAFAIGARCFEKGEWPFTGRKEQAMLPETFDALLVPAVLAGVVWMFVALVLFKFGIELTDTEKQRTMAVLTVISGALVALVQVLPPEQQQQLASVYQVVRPVLEFVLGTILAGGTAYTVNQGAYRVYRYVVPKEDPVRAMQEGRDKKYPVVG